eukprot:1736213-Pyramimonas_sp.AAC.2
MLKKAGGFLAWQAMFVSAFLVRPLCLEGEARVHNLCDVQRRDRIQLRPGADLGGGSVKSEEFCRMGAQ